MFSYYFFFSPNLLAHAKAWRPISSLPKSNQDYLSCCCRGTRNARNAFFTQIPRLIKGESSVLFFLCSKNVSLWLTVCSHLFFLTDSDKVLRNCISLCEMNILKQFTLELITMNTSDILIFPTNFYLLNFPMRIS